MIKDIYKRTHEITTKGIKKATNVAKSVVRKDQKIITLGDILKIYPEGKLFLSDSNDEPLYNFNMDNFNIVMMHLDDEIEWIRIGMFPNVKTQQADPCISIKLK